MSHPIQNESTFQSCNPIKLYHFKIGELVATLYRYSSITFLIKKSCGVRANDQKSCKFKCIHQHEVHNFKTYDFNRTELLIRNSICFCANSLESNAEWNVQLKQVFPSHQETKRENFTKI